MSQDHSNRRQSILRSPSALVERSSENKQLGVLLTGFLEKQNPYGKVFRRRFVVLTQEAFHWFKKEENDHLFGEERGQVSLKSIETVRILDEDQSQFELLTENFTRRYFRCKDSVECEEWVSAIRSAVKTIMTERKKTRAKSVYNSEGQKYADPSDSSQNTTEVKVLLVSLVSSANAIETVISRNPGWGRLIFVRDICADDTVLLSTSNGGTVSLSYATLQDKADLGKPFDVAIQNVLLASSLSVLVVSEPPSGPGVEPSVAIPQGTKQSLREEMMATLQIISGDQYSVETLIIALMVIGTGVKSFSTLAWISSSAPSVVLFATLALLFSCHSASQVIGRTRKKQSAGKEAEPETFHLTIIEHQYTSPDAPVKAPEDEIPQRFLNAVDGDIREARRRWDATRKWRETENIDNILNEEQPFFTTIKTMYPHYLCGRGKEGNVVYYERPGEIEIPQLNARGIGIDEMLRHWLFVTEYQYNVVVTGELEKCITVIDIEKVGMGDLAGDALDFVRKSVAIANHHYPERAFVIFLVNVPSWFSFIWRVVKPLVHENTQKKIKILSKKEVLAGLNEFIDFDQIPVYYGGGRDMGGHDSCRYESEFEKDMAEYVRRLNAKCRGEPVEEKQEEDLSATSVEENDDDGSVAGPEGEVDAPPGAPGDMTRMPAEIRRRRSMSHVQVTSDILKAQNALENGDASDAGGSDMPPRDAPALSSDWSIASAAANTDSGPHTAYKPNTAPRRSGQSSLLKNGNNQRPQLCDDWSISTIGTVNSPEKPVVKSSVSKMFSSIDEN